MTDCRRAVCILRQASVLSATFMKPARDATCDGEELLVRDLRHEVYVQYDRGMYSEALRIAEEIYTIDAVSTRLFRYAHLLTYQHRRAWTICFFWAQSTFSFATFRNPSSTINRCVSRSGS